MPIAGDYVNKTKASAFSVSKHFTAVHLRLQIVNVAMGKKKSDLFYL